MYETLAITSLSIFILTSIICLIALIYNFKKKNYKLFDIFYFIPIGAHILLITINFFILKLMNSQGSIGSVYALPFFLELIVVYHVSLFLFFGLKKWRLILIITQAVFFAYLSLALIAFYLPYT